MIKKDTLLGLKVKRRRLNAHGLQEPCKHLEDQPGAEPEGEPRSSGSQRGEGPLNDRRKEGLQGKGGGRRDFTIRPA